MTRAITLATCLVATALFTCSPALADAKPPAEAARSAKKQTLDRLFTQLKSAKTEDGARTIANNIWREWFKSGNADVTPLMARYRYAQRAGLRKEALKTLNKVIQLDPGFAEGWNQRATLYFILGRNAESIADIQKVLELEPRHFGALAGLGLIHMREQNWKSAIASFERALEIHPFLGERNLIPALKKKLKGQAL